MHITACIRGIAITTNNTDLLCVVGAVIVLEQPLQRHPALNVLVVECCVVIFALERAVPVVLDAVVCPSRQQLSNHCPLVAMCLPQRNSCPQKEVARVRAACHHRHVAVHSSNYEDHRKGVLWLTCCWATCCEWSLLDQARRRHPAVCRILHKPQEAST